MTAASVCALEIDGPAGRLEARLALPAGEPRLAAVVCHPHPLYGGKMQNKVTHAIAKGLVAAGAAALRFNFRGVGLSEGTHDAGRGERDDLRAALDRLAAIFPRLPLLAAGYSFGAWVALEAGAADPRVAALAGVGLATTLHRFEALERSASAKPTLLVQGERDEYGPVPDVRALAERLRPPARLVVVAGAGHFFEGKVDEVATGVAEFARALHRE